MLSGVNSPAGGNQNQAVVQAQNVQQTASNQPQVSLSLLIEYLVQKVYHELNVLAELLPRKTDMERKVMIFQFASRTRMLFVRFVLIFLTFKITHNIFTNILCNFQKIQTCMKIEICFPDPNAFLSGLFWFLTFKITHNIFTNFLYNFLFFFFVPKIPKCCMKISLNQTCSENHDLFKLLHENFLETLTKIHDFSICFLSGLLIFCSVHSGYLYCIDGYKK